MSLRAKLEPVLADYLELLQRVDGWFARCLEGYGEQISCSQGCSACCRGLFDITLLDACLLQKGFERLAAPVRQAVHGKARQRLVQLQGEWPDFAPPYTLNHMPDGQWTEMPEDDQTPCPLLGDDGLCLVYDFRPMICRLHGIPNVDRSGESFSDDWCTLNFQGLAPLQEARLRWDFRAAFEQELALFDRFGRELFGGALNELDTFIPTALLIDFEHFDWYRYLRQHHG